MKLKDLQKRYFKKLMQKANAHNTGFVCLSQYTAQNAAISPSLTVI